MNKKNFFLINIHTLSLLLLMPTYVYANPGLNFDVTGGVSTRFDDNVTFVKNNKTEDIINQLDVGFNLMQDGKTHIFEMQGNLTQHLYIENSSFNNISQNIRANLKKELSKYDRITITNRFLHSEEPRSFEDDFGRTAGRYSYYRNNFDIAYEHDLSKQWLVSGRYGNEFYNASRASILDSFLNRIGLDLSYIQSSATVYLIGYDFLTRNYDGAGASNVHTIGTGLRHFLTKQLSFDSRVGVSIIESISGSNSTELNIFVSLTNDFSENDSASISYRRTSTPSSFTTDVFDSWRVAVNWGRQLLERLRMTGSVFFGEGDFDSLNITDKQTGVSTRLSYDLTKNATAFIGYTYSEVDSNRVSRSYDRNLVEVGVRLIF